MLITEIYQQYPVNKGLQAHMVRVAAVAKLICDHSTSRLNTHNIVSACLLHDMGNLLKTKFELNPEAFEPEGVEYWKQLKEEMTAKYGTDVYAATSEIITEINPPQEIKDTIESASFDKIKTVAESGSVEAKILLYADMRIGLNGVVTLEGRFNDLASRYVPDRFSQSELEARQIAAQKIEQELFADLSIRPEGIADQSIPEIQNELLNWEIKTN